MCERKVVTKPHYQKMPRIAKRWPRHKAVATQVRLTEKAALSPVADLQEVLPPRLRIILPRPARRSMAPAKASHKSGILFLRIPRGGGKCPFQAIVDKRTLVLQIPQDRHHKRKQDTLRIAGQVSPPPFGKSIHLIHDDTHDVIVVHKVPTLVKHQPQVLHPSGQGAGRCGAHPLHQNRDTPFTGDDLDRIQQAVYARSSSGFARNTTNARWSRS